MSTISDVYLGIGVTQHAILIVSSLGQRSSITSEGLRTPADWIELATYGIPLPEKHRLLACVALPSGYPREDRGQIVEAARQAGWDGVLTVNALHAAGRALRERHPEGINQALIVVDSAVSSVGILRGDPLGLIDHDPVHAIAGREAREVAVSLRVLLKQRRREEARELLRRVLVVGEANEVERIGRRQFEKELEGLGAQQIEFELEPFLIPQGAALIASETEGQTWRRIRRRWSRG